MLIRTLLNIPIALGVGGGGMFCARSVLYVLCSGGGGLVDGPPDTVIFLIWKYL